MLNLVFILGKPSKEKKTEIYWSFTNTLKYISVFFSFEGFPKENKDTN